jgi:hypothetical protein
MPSPCLGRPVLREARRCGHASSSRDEATGRPESRGVAPSDLGDRRSAPGCTTPTSSSTRPSGQSSSPAGVEPSRSPRASSRCPVPDRLARRAPRHAEVPACVRLPTWQYTDAATSAAALNPAVNVAPSARAPTGTAAPAKPGLTTGRWPTPCVWWAQVGTHTMGEMVRLYGCRVAHAVPTG